MLRRESGRPPAAPKAAEKPHEKNAEKAQQENQAQQQQTSSDSTVGIAHQTQQDAAIPKTYCASSKKHPSSCCCKSNFDCLTCCGIFCLLIPTITLICILTIAVDFRPFFAIPTSPCKISIRQQGISQCPFAKCCIDDGYLNKHTLPDSDGCFRVLPCPAFLNAIDDTRVSSTPGTKICTRDRFDTGGYESWGTVPGCKYYDTKYNTTLTCTPIMNEKHGSINEKHGSINNWKAIMRGSRVAAADPRMDWNTCIHLGTYPCATYDVSIALPDEDYWNVKEEFSDLVEAVVRNEATFDDATLTITIPLGNEFRRSTSMEDTVIFWKGGGGLQSWETW